MKMTREQREQFCQQVEKHARMLAFGGKIDAGWSPADAEKYALRHWRQHVEQALDVLAVFQVIDQDEAAPFN